MYSNSSLVSYTRLSSHHSGQRKHSIDRITPHCIVGQWTAKKGCDYFATTPRSVSANYIIGRDGDVGLSVEEKNRSWCSSSRENDQRAVTIECASESVHPYTFKPVVYQALVNLCVDICKRNNKNKLLWFGDKNKTLNYSPAPDEMILTVHRWFAAKSCPGDWMYTRMGDLANEVTEQLSANNDEADSKVNKFIDELYRVRKSWKDFKSQIGAFKTLDYAKKQVDKNPGYSVFDKNGNIVYSNLEEAADNAKIIWNFLKNKGMNDFAIAGIMGNLYAESSLKPTNLQNSYEKKLGINDVTYTKAVDNNTYVNFVTDRAGYGLAQWTYWSRKNALLKYAKQVGKSIGDLSMQLNFLWEEMLKYTNMMWALNKVDTVRKASDIILTQYERPLNQGESVKIKRAQFGENFYKRFSKSENE